MKFSYSDFWVNKCSRKEYIDSSITKLALSLYKSTAQRLPYDFNVDALYSLTEKHYNFEGLNDSKYKETLFASLKNYLIKIKTGKSKHLLGDDDLSKLPDTRFTKIFEDAFINACIQYNQRKYFHFVDEPPEKLLEYIKKGYSYSWHFKENYRSGKNFECSDIVCVDIDDKKKFDSLESVIADPFVSQYALIVHPSYSYDAMSGNLKCRVIFRVKNTIYNPDDFTYLNKGLIDHFKSDPAINIDSCLYGCNKNLLMINDHSMIEFNPQNILPKTEIDKLIVIGKSLSNTQVEKTTSASQNKIVRQNHSTLACPEAPFFEYQNKRLEFIYHHDVIDSKVVGNICGSINDSNPTASILCPYHNDTSPSAWITRTKDRSIFLLKCSAPGCIETRWITNPTYHESSKAFIPPTISTQVHPPKSRLSHLPVIPGVHIIRSPKGSGKTYRLEEMLRSVLPETSVLAITHLRSLARHIGHRLGLDCYIDSADNISGNYTNRFICGTASLFKVFCDNDPTRTPRKYNILILDEFEQLLEQLFNNDIIFNTASRRNAISILNHIFINADIVFVLDADIGFVSFNYIDLLILEKKRLGINHHADYLLNEYKQDREVHICSDKIHFYSEVLKAFDSGDNSIIVSNRRRELIHIYYTLIFYAQHRGASSFKILLIDGFSSKKDQRVRDFIDDPSTEAKKYNFILYNQAMVSGVSIDCTDNFNNVFGCFYQTITGNSTSTPFSNSQMLNRYRSKTAPFKLWIENYKVKKKPQRKPVAGGSLLDNVINTLEKDCNNLFNVNFTDYYRSHMAYFLECGYKIKMLDLTAKEFNSADRIFSHDTSIFYYITEDFSKAVFKKLPQQDQDKYKLLRNIFSNLQFDIYFTDLSFSPNSKAEVLDPTVCRLIPYLNRSKLDLSCINQKSSIDPKKLKVKPFLKNIFKNIYLQVDDGGFVGPKGNKNPLYDVSISWEMFRKS
ncbi:MAG: hypothetical protein HQL69_06210 [Magnetococcales bacterium]|nr:hypothetical protein [Magnetococcales bacterium]